MNSCHGNYLVDKMSDFIIFIMTFSSNYIHDIFVIVVAARIYCTYEGSENDTCHQLKSVPGMENSEDWVTGIAEENYPESDHTLDQRKLRPVFGGGGG